MDYLCKFLCLDLYDLLVSGVNKSRQQNVSKAGCQSPGQGNAQQQSSYVVHQLSYKIHHKYPKRLITYDAEEACEPRLIRFADLSKSVIKSIMKQCEEEMACEKPKPASKCKDDVKDKHTDKDTSGCKECQQAKQCPQPRSIFQMLKDLTAVCLGSGPTAAAQASCSPRPALRSALKQSSKYCGANEQPSKSCIQPVKGLLTGSGKCEPTHVKLDMLEQLAKQLHNGSLCPTAKWDVMPATQKLGYYWQALTGDQLCKSPYENFKQSYAKAYRRRCPRISGKRLRNQMREEWQCMDKCYRMPFIVQSLIYQVSTGAVDLSDHCSVRAALRKLH